MPVRGELKRKKRNLRMLLEGLEGTVAVFLNNRLVLKDLVYRAWVVANGDIHYFGRSAWSLEEARELMSAKVELWYDEDEHRHRAFVGVYPMAVESIGAGEILLWLQRWGEGPSSPGWEVKFINNRDDVAIFLFTRRGFVSILREGQWILIQRAQYPSLPLINPTWTMGLVKEVLSMPWTFNEELFERRGA
ncbi:MAG: hypothetical protein L7H04_07090 [Vulcanisaeta sp.]|nr:hypothetical protein [Vulcanisaeta sp.]MCG2892605.1 hypothetical protein [Vulcanisaeta sp.]